MSDVAELMIQGIFKALSLFKNKQIKRITIAVTQPEHLIALKKSLRKKLIMISE